MHHLVGKKNEMAKVGIEPLMARAIKTVAITINWDEYFGIRLKLRKPSISN